MLTDGGVVHTQIDSQLPGFVSTEHGKFSKFIQKYYEFLELNLITFTDLDLNEDAVLQEKANTTYNITVATGNNAYSNSANKFYVGGEVSPTITLTTGAYAIFDQGDETNAGHYFYISETPDGIHTAGGSQFTTDARGDLLFTYEGEPADYDNITLEDDSGILLYEDYLDSVNFLDNVTLEDGTGILLYEDEVEIGYETTPDREIGLELASTISFYVSPDLAGKTLYYYCNNHSGMGGNITVSTVTSYISQENGNTDSANTSTDYITFEDEKRQGEQFLSGETIEGANSGATGIVKGKYSTTQVYVQETNNGTFEVGETIRGISSRATANISSYSRQPINASRNVKSFQDIDKAPAGFVELFRKEFIRGFGVDSVGNTSTLLKNIKDFYRSKGNENSFRYIFRLLFGITEVEFYYPGTDITRLSDGRWKLDKSVKIFTNLATAPDSFLGRTIVGQTSNVSAVVERIERYQIGSEDITELFLSRFDANNSAYEAVTGTNYANFSQGETIKADSADDDGVFASAPTSGILESVDVVYGGSQYAVGDPLLVTAAGGSGEGAKAEVGSIAAASLTGVDVIDSGDGYTVGDVVVFVNDGTGGTGAAARVDTIVKTANVFTQNEVISTQSNTTIDAAAFASPWAPYNRNVHNHSNSTTTFTVPFDGLSGGATPKAGDFIAKFGSGESITIYSPANSKYGTVVSTNSTSITYALGSIAFEKTYNTDPTLTNFVNNDTVTIFDLTKEVGGNTAHSNGENSGFVATGATIAINGTPTANSDTSYHGAATMQETSIGGVRSVQILSSGQGYETMPAISVSNSEIAFYGPTEYKVGANSIFVTLSNTIANSFTANTLIKNQTNNAFGVVLDFLDESATSLAEAGNTVLRVQMTSANTFSTNDTLTSYSQLDSSPTGIGEFGTASIEVSGATATFTQNTHGFSAGDRIVVTGSSSATDNTVYNNNHTILDIVNTSTYTVTLPSSPTDTSETALNVRQIVTANVIADLILTEDETTTQLSFENGVGTANDDYSTSASNGSIIVESTIDEANATFANTGIPGNNAVIKVSSLAVGAIETVKVTNFGAGYGSAPIINASAVGDGTAELKGNLGVYAEYAGYFDGNYGLLSGTTKMQDNFYYQDFSYVVKTDKDVATYRDKILELVHPAGMALFGEIQVSSNVFVKLFDNATNNINSTQANTALVSNSVGALLFRTKEVEIMPDQGDCQCAVEKSYDIKGFSTEITIIEKFDVYMDTTGSSVQFDLQLEHGNDIIQLEESGFFLALDNIGELLLEQDLGGGVGDRLIEETVDSLLTEEELVRILLEQESNDTDEDVLILDDGETDKGNSTVKGAFLDERSHVSGPFIYEFFEPFLGRVLGEDDSVLILEGLEPEFPDVITIDESFGDFIVMDGLRILNFIELEEGRGHIELEDTTSAPLDSAGKILNEDSEPTPTLDGAHFVQEDESGQFSQGFKIRQETFSSFVTEGQLVYEDDTFPLLERQVEAGDRPLGLETPLGDIQETVFMELEEAVGGGHQVRSDKISHFVLEEDEDTIYTLKLEDGFDLLNENEKESVLLETQPKSALLKIRNEEEASNFQMENFECYLVQDEIYSILLESYTLPALTDSGVIVQENNDALSLEEADSSIDDTPAYFTFEDDDSDSRAYLLEEPTTVFFNIRGENDADDLEYIITNHTEERIALEIEEFITDTNFKGESYDVGNGFTLPMLIFPTAEAGSALLDLSFTSRIVMDIDDIQNIRLENDQGDLHYEDDGKILYEQQEPTSTGYQYDFILLEESDSTNPVYIATESSMTEEVDTLREIDIVSDGDMSIQLENIHGTHDNGFLINEESSGIRIEAGTGAEGEIIFEDEEKLLIEVDPENKFQVGWAGVAASVTPTVSTLNTGDTLNEGSFLERGFKNTGRSYGAVALSLLSGEFELTTEDGRSFVSEASISSQPDNLIAEAYERGVTATGTATQFEFDFNNLIVLESVEVSLDVVQLEDDTVPGETGGKLLLEGNFLEHQHGFGEALAIEIQDPRSSRKVSQVGVIEMELDTPEDNSIILESDDPDVFELIQMEGASIVLEDNTEGVGNIVTEDDFFIVQERGSNGSLATEEDVHTTIADPARLVGVGLHDLILEEEGILQEASDQIKLEDFTFDNITQEEFTIGQFVPFFGFEPHNDSEITLDDNLLLESETHKSENAVIQAEDGDLIVDESDGTSHFVLEDFFFKYYNVGTITQSGTTITVSGGEFPSAVVGGGRFYYQNGEESSVITAVSANLLEITVEDSKTISSAENYKVEYGLDDTPKTEDGFLVMEAFTLDPTAELVRIDLIFNGTGDVNHGYTRGEDSDGFGTFTLSIAAFTDIVGNDIIYEDGDRILAEDSIGGYIAFQDSPLNVSLGIAHSKVLNEDDTGGFISTEDHEGNETTQDDNVLMKEMSDALLLETSETETFNYVLSEEEGQMMLEDVFQVSEHKIVFEGNDSILVEDQPDTDNYKLLNLDMARFDISRIANNVSMTIETTDSSTSATDFFKRSDSAILVSRSEQIV